MTTADKPRHVGRSRRPHLGILAVVTAAAVLAAALSAAATAAASALAGGAL